jgi:hypothetical protein
MANFEKITCDDLVNEVDAYEFLTNEQFRELYEFKALDGIIDSDKADRFEEFLLLSEI